MKVEEQRNVCPICNQEIIHKKIEKQILIEGKEVHLKCFKKKYGYKSFRTEKDEDDDM